MECNERPEIKYPCEWSFTIIGIDKQLLRDAAELVMEKREYILQYSKSSRTGKYHSWSVDLVVSDEGDRNEVYSRLKSHIDVKMVI